MLLSPYFAAWVWDDPDISDEEWADRLRRKADYPKPIAVLRITPPEAYVVVIGQAEG